MAFLCSPAKLATSKRRQKQIYPHIRCIFRICPCLCYRHVGQCPFSVSCDDFTCTSFYYDVIITTLHEHDTSHISRSKLDLIKHFKLYHVKVWNKPKALHLGRGTTVSSSCSGESLNGRRNGTNESLDRSLSNKAGSHGFTHESRIDGVPVLLIMDTMFTGMPRHVASLILTVNLAFESARRLKGRLFF